MKNNKKKTISVLEKMLDIILEDDIHLLTNDSDSTCEASALIKAIESIKSIDTYQKKIDDLTKENKELKNTILELEEQIYGTPETPLEDDDYEFNL